MKVWARSCSPITIALTAHANLLQRQIKARGMLFSSRAARVMPPGDDALRVAECLQ